MFDPVTTALISTGPTLDGVDLDDLPKQFTRAFADIVAARVRLRDDPEAVLSEGLVATLLRMRRLAAAHEALVALLPDRENRVAAAFIAATAHQTYAFGETVRQNEPRKSYIESATVSPEVCTTLLFMVADSFADAAEASKAIRPDQDRATEIEKALLLSIARLARGELRAISTMENPAFDLESSLDAQAQQALLYELFTGVKNLAAQLQLRVDVGIEAGGVESARATFERVKALCVEQIDDIIDDKKIYSLFPGPLHLANLLLAVERDLIASALTRTPRPGGVGEAGWWHIIRRMAHQRPFLWKNHRDAIGNGYLEQGVSAAISFPTGGGKSTLAELKIATALLRGEQVVFLAPTNALVDQTTSALKKTFHDYNIVGDTDDEVTFTDIVVLPEVIVTTPERCLLLHSVQPEAFENLGLIIFDECHLMHPRDSDRSRRSVDAMLTVLNLTATAPNADLLMLSAMMKNAEEIASWVSQLTGRSCLPLDFKWKPTRQVRGTVVYPAQRISELNGILHQARRDFPNKKNGAPAAIERQLTAPPFGLFCLLQNWASNAQEDYALLPLLKEAPHFTTARRTGGRWALTPNGNKLSAAIAAASAASRIKTLVFVQSTVLAHAASKEVRERLETDPVVLNETEQKLYDLAVEEMGGANYCYLKLEDDGTFQGGATSHHALLLREERHLHESMFKRADGINVLFATSTLAQGMNLPSEIVIIAGDSRFDPEADKMAVLEAHELLNAAGRAGRAGERSQGFVLVVPSRVIDFDEETGQIDGHWETLKNIFEQGDQCLTIDDPFTGLLDRIHNGAVLHGMPTYLLSKLPVSAGDDQNAAARALLSRSFAAYRASLEGKQDWIESRIGAALAAKNAMDNQEERSWIDLVSGSTGVSIQNLRAIQTLLDDGELVGSAHQVMAALLGWIALQPERLLDLVRPENLEGLFGEPYKQLKTDSARGSHAIPALLKLLPLWMAGKPLCELEREFIEDEDVGLCKYARHFALRIVPDLAFIAGLPARILAARSSSAQMGGEEAAPIPTVLATLQAIVREGCDSPETLASRLNLGRDVSRVRARERHVEYQAYIPDGDNNETFETTRERVRTGALLFSLNESDE
ncbi:DEAD/DEAH box helicase [Sinorhizobium meliloti]|uniref:DEAD/DEAH box helicase n=1 Tax=Rhizobium meliloti TaxID=382 RepID=UPI003D65983F